MGRIKGLFILILFWGLQLNAQDRYMVFFKDKQGTNFSLDNPIEFLSQRSIDRKSRNQIKIDSLDLPVSDEYVTQISSAGADVFFTSRWMNAALVQMTEEVQKAVGDLAFVENVEFIAPEAPLSRNQTSYQIATNFKEVSSTSGNSDDQLEQIGADHMHNDGFTGEGKWIAVFDAGFPGVNEYEPFQHIHDENRLVGTKDFIRNSGNVFQYHSHGSSVLSLIAADSKEGLKGSAPDASFLLCVTEDVSTEYRIEEYNWLLAAEYVDSAGADVINSSVGYSDFDDENMNYSYSDMDGRTSVIAQAATLASDKGIVVVTSAGNYGNNSWYYITTPADAPRVLSIGSVEIDGTKASHSSFGPTYDGRVKPDVCALGYGSTIFSYSSGSGKITKGNGTSYASPLIAGFAACVWQVFPEQSSQEIVQVVRRSGSNYENPSDSLGYGVANYSRISDEDLIITSSLMESNIEVYPNPFHGEHININFNETINGKIEIKLLDVHGKVLFDQKYRGLDLPGILQIEIDAPVNGMYFLTLRSREFNKTIKLIKE